MMKTYTVPEKNGWRQIARGFWVGSTFTDHGQKMRITRIGAPYKDPDGKGKLIDFEAEPVEGKKL